MSRLAQYLELAMEELELPESGDDEIGSLDEIDFNDPDWAVAEQSFDDLETVGVLESAMEQFIAVGKRQQAEYCFRKIDAIMESLSDRHGLIYRSRSTRVELESLDNTGWLSYAQEGIVSGIAHAIKSILTLIAGAISKAIAFIKKIISHVTGGRTKLKAQLAAAENTAAEISYKGIYSWDLKDEWLDPRGAVHELFKIDHDVLESTNKYFVKLASILSDEQVSVGEVLKDYHNGKLTEYTLINTDETENTVRALKHEERLMSSCKGVYIGGLVIAPTEQIRQEIASKYKNKYAETDAAASWVKNPSNGLRLSQTVFQLHPNEANASPRLSITHRGPGNFVQEDLYRYFKVWTETAISINTKIERISKQSDHALNQGHGRLIGLADQVTNSLEIKDLDLRHKFIARLGASSTTQREILHVLTVDTMTLVKVVTRLIQNGSGGFIIAKS